MKARRLRDYAIRIPYNNTFLRKRNIFGCVDNLQEIILTILDWKNIIFFLHIATLKLKYFYLESHPRYLRFMFTIECKIWALKFDNEFFVWLYNLKKTCLVQLLTNGENFSSRNAYYVLFAFYEDCLQCNFLLVLMWKKQYLVAFLLFTCNL